MPQFSVMKKISLQKFKRHYCSFLNEYNKVFTSVERLLMKLTNLPLKSSDMFFGPRRLNNLKSDIITNIFTRTFV